MADTRSIKKRVNFARGDLVRIAKKFPSHMCHFDGRGCLAIVIEPSRNSYGLLILEKNVPPNCIWWYDRELLTFISEGSYATELIVREFLEGDEED